MAKRFVFGIWIGGVEYGDRLPTMPDLERFGSLADAIGRMEARAKYPDIATRFDYVYKPAEYKRRGSGSGVDYIDTYVIRAESESDALALLESQTISSVRHSFREHADIRHADIL